MKLRELITKLEDVGKRHNLLDKTVKVYDELENTCDDIDIIEIKTAFCQDDYKYPTCLPSELLELDPSKYKQHNLEEYVEVVLITEEK